MRKMITSVLFLACLIASSLSAQVLSTFRQLGKPADSCYLVAAVPGVASATIVPLFLHDECKSMNMQVGIEPIVSSSPVSYGIAIWPKAFGIEDGPQTVLAPLGTSLILGGQGLCWAGAGQPLPVCKGFVHNETPVIAVGQRFIPAKELERVPIAGPSQAYVLGNTIAFAGKFAGDTMVVFWQLAADGKTARVYVAATYGPQTSSSLSVTLPDEFSLESEVYAHCIDLDGSDHLAADYLVYDPRSTVGAAERGQ